MIKEKVYKKPIILDHQPISFETAHSWNKGIGNKNPSSPGNNGLHYPLDPRPGKPSSGVPADPTTSLNK